MLSAWPNWDLVFDFLTAPLRALVAAYQRLLVSYYITHDSMWGNDSSYSSVCPLLWTAEPSWLFAELKSIQWPLNFVSTFPLISTDTVWSWPVDEFWISTLWFILHYRNVFWDMYFFSICDVWSLLLFYDLSSMCKLKRVCVRACGGFFLLFFCFLFSILDMMNQLMCFWTVWWHAKVCPLLVNMTYCD